MLFNQLIIGFHISNNSLGQIQITMTLSISIVKIQNLCPNLGFKFELSKTIWPHLRISYHSKVTVEMVTEGHFSTHFERD